MDRRDPAWKKAIAMLLTQECRRTAAEAGPAIMALLDQALPIFLGGLATRLEISPDEARAYWDEHIVVEIGNTASGSPVSISVEYEADKAHLRLNPSGRTVAEWTAGQLADTLAHELDHFFQELFVYERDYKRHKDESEKPWHDRTHEQGAIIAEIRNAKGRGITKEEFMASVRERMSSGPNQKGPDVIMERLQVYDHLWDLEDDVMPSSTVGRLVLLGIKI